MTAVPNRWNFPPRSFPTSGIGYRPLAHGHSPVLRTLVIGAWSLVILALPSRALDAAEQMQFADGLYSRGLYELASTEYRALLTNAATTARDAATFRLAECQRQLGNKDSAVQLYGELVAKFPQSEFRFRGEFRRAEMQITAGDFPKAVEYFRALLAANPPPDVRGPCLYYSGFAHDRIARTNEAEAAYAELVAKFPQSPFYSLASVSLGELKEKRGAPAAEPRELYTKAAAAAASPRVGAEALFKLADLEFRNRNYAASADAYTKLQATYPADERTTANQLAIAWANHNASRFPAALQIANASLPAAPEAQRAEWLYVKANCERQLKQDEAAIRDYTDMIQRFPTSPLATAAAQENAVLLFQKNRHADVLALAASLAPATGPANVDALWMLAESYTAQKQPAPAIAGYRRLIDSFPQNERAPLSLFRIGKLQQQNNQPDEASVTFRAFAKSFPQHTLAADALAASAECLLKIGRKDAAVADWAALAAGYTSFTALDQAIFAKAQAEVDLGKIPEAKKSLEQFIQLCPKSPLLAKARYTLGALQEKSGELDPAAYNYAVALALKPDADLTQTLQFRRIAVLQRQGKNDDAAAMLQPMLASPALAKIPSPQLDWLARWQISKHNHAAAEEAARHLTARTDAPALQISGHYLAGLAQQAQKKMPDARLSFETVIAATNIVSNRETIEAFQHLGEVLLALNDAPGATAAFSRAAEQASTDATLAIRARSYHGLGLATAAQGKWEEASRYFMSVAVLFDDPALTPECLHRAAEAFAKQNKISEQQKTIEELKRRYPDSEWAKRNDQ